MLTPVVRAVDLLLSEGSKELVAGMQRYLRRMFSGPYKKYAQKRHGRNAVFNINGSHMSIDTEAAGIDEQLLLDRTKERDSTLRLQKLLSEQKGIYRNIIFLDIGANIGYYTLLACSVLRGHGRIYAFEPDKTNYGRLCSNLELNKYRSECNVETRNVAVGNRNRTATLNIKATGNSHMLSSTDHNDRETVEQIKITVESIANILSEINFGEEDLLVLKVDVEGAESEIIPELKSVIDTPQPIAVMCELHPDRLSSSEQKEIISVLRSLSLDFVSLNGGSNEDKGVKWSDLETIESNTQVLAIRIS